MNLLKAKVSKPDSKGRFLSRAYTQKLHGARTFKRPIIPIPVGNIGKLLRAVGLEKWYAQLLVVLFFVVIIFWLYNPVFLRITNIEVEGGAQEQQLFAKSLTEEFLKSRGYLGVPQNNLLLVSKEALIAQLLKRDPALKDSIIIRRKLPGTLKVILNFRSERFLVSDSQSLYLYFDDGLISRKVSENPAQFFDQPAGGLIKLWWQEPLSGPKAANHSGYENLLAIPNQVVLTAERAVKAFHPPAGGIIDFVVAGQPPLMPKEIDGARDPRTNLREEISPTDLVLYIRFNDSKPDILQGGYKIYIDGKSDIEENLARAEILLAKRPVDKQKSLYYIDLRTVNRAFLCDIGAVCSQPKAPEVLVDPRTEIKENLDTLPPVLQPKPRGQ